MKVKVGNKWYYSEDQPIAVQLSKEEREQVSSMSDDSLGVYCQFPSTYNKSYIEQWMVRDDN